MPPVEEAQLTTEEVADRLGVSIQTVRRWIRSGELGAYSLGSTKLGYRVSEADYQRFLAARRAVKFAGGAAARAQG